MNSYCHFSSPLGAITVVENGEAITHLHIGEGVPVSDAQPKQTPLLEETCQQLSEYFAGTRQKFDLPLAPPPGQSSRKTWEALCSIPYGQTRTYKDMALAIGCPKGFRAVGLANNKNPIAIIVPCHRVIGANGKLVGYAGGVHLKKFLLALEGIAVEQ